MTGTRCITLVGGLVRVKNKGWKAVCFKNASQLVTFLSGEMQKQRVLKWLPALWTHYERKMSRYGKSEALRGTPKWRLPKRLTHLTFALSTVGDFMTLCWVCSLAVMFSLVAVNWSLCRLPELLNIPPPTQFIVHTLTKSHHMSLGKCHFTSQQNGILHLSDAELLSRHWTDHDSRLKNVHLSSSRV